ncbi:hypothetical protein H0H93_014228 [Arthromyces matolae]|nr:hypothetical protein H0H93_014228 [Arthromyces matolae]
MATACKHNTLRFTPSPHANRVGFIRVAEDKLTAATQPTGRNSKQVPEILPSTFPGPLILPEDDLALDPRCPPQSLRSWLRSKDKNPITHDKSIIYVAAPPHVDLDVSFIQSWAQSQQSTKIASPAYASILDYLAAFYHGVPVKPLPAKLSFTGWDNNLKKSKPMIPKYIGLNTSTECVGIRTRISPDGIFPVQLNLDDLLDAAISMLPEDAYALLLLVDHDIFESDEDEFVCGRAYGGSRVAVISTARYRPDLDDTHNVDREHAWPASHCSAYIEQICADADQQPFKKRARGPADIVPLTHNHTADSPMHVALATCNSFRSNMSSPSPETLAGLWLGRVCRTASHELGHCFGMEHCVYYACSMQGSSSLAEDARQPPYLCPVDLAKLLHATAATDVARYQAILSFCSQHKDNHLFTTFAGWIDARLQLKINDVEASNQSKQTVSINRIPPNSIHEQRGLSGQALRSHTPGRKAQK